jgi:hypothetical protein
MDGNETQVLFLVHFSRKPCSFVDNQRNGLELARIVTPCAHLITCLEKSSHGSGTVEYLMPALTVHFVGAFLSFSSKG